MPDAACLKVPKNLGEQAIRLVGNLELFNRELKVQQVGNHLYIPLTADPSLAVLKKFEINLQDFEISVHNFPEREKRHLVPLDFLTGKLPPNLLARVPRAIDFVGDIAMVEISTELADHRTTIGEAILKAHKQVSTVLAKSGAVEGVYRLRDFEVIAGVEKTTTVHREYGCVYYVDVAKAYFSPRLSSEHNRVASQVKEDEIVVDLFAGVGPFSILIAKRQSAVKVYAVDVNPDAIALLKRNIAMNRVEKQVVPVLGDARKVVREELMGVADRVIMNLPETSIEYVDVACDAIRSEGGIMHYYGFTKDSEPMETARVRLTEAVSNSNRQLKKIKLATTVREVAPYTWQVVVDAKIH